VSKQTESGNGSDGNATTDRRRRQQRSRLSQADVPAYTLEEALRVPEAIRDNYGKQPTRPLMVAAAMNLVPTTGGFRMITGAAVAYGLTDGAAQAELIGLTSLGKRIIGSVVNR
jgi:hypothetical protein